MSTKSSNLITIELSDEQNLLQKWVLNHTDDDKILINMFWICFFFEFHRLVADNC